MLKKCFSTLGCPSYSLDEVLRTAQRYNMDCVEIRVLEHEIDLPAYFLQKGITPNDLKLRCEESGIHIAAFDSSLKLTSRESEWTETLNTWAPWMIAAKVPAMRIFDGTCDDTFEGWIKHAKSRLKLWKKLKKTHRWKFDLLVETHDTLLTSASILSFLEATQGIFPILWDAHHTWRKGGEKIEETWQNCHRDIQHIHIKNSTGEPSARHPYTYTELSQGEMDLATLFKLLSDSSYTGVLSLEWERMWHPYLNPLENALSGFCSNLQRIEGSGGRRLN